MARPPMMMPTKTSRFDKIMVYPTSKNATVMRHPIDGQLKASGSLWTEDGLTMRGLLDGSLTTNQALAWKDPTPVVDLTIPPPHATAVPDNPPTMAITTRSKSLL